MNIIKKIKLEQVTDSRDKPTIKATLQTAHSTGTATSPAGTSSGKTEARHLPKPAQELIITARETLIPKLIGQDPQDQETIDTTMKEKDGTELLENIGGAIILSISMANAKAAASDQNKELYEQLAGKNQPTIPYPLGKCIGGGAHSHNPNAPDIQEFLILPVSAKSMHEAITSNNQTHKKKLLLSPCKPLTHRQLPI